MNDAGDAPSEASRVVRRGCETEQIADDGPDNAKARRPAAGCAASTQLPARDSHAGGDWLDIRDASPPDALEIARVHVRSWQAAYRGIFDDGFLDSLRPEDRVHRYSLEEGGSGPRTVVAERGGEIAGFATVGPSRDADAADAAELYAVYVDPSEWRGGVGRLLLLDAEERMRALGVERGILWVLEGNVRAHRFYRAAGWNPDGARREEDVWSVPAVVVRYVKAL